MTEVFTDSCEHLAHSASKVWCLGCVNAMRRDVMAEERERAAEIAERESCTDDGACADVECRAALKIATTIRSGE